MKFGRAGKLFYFAFILILLGFSAYIVKWTWGECEVYKDASAAARMNQAITYIEGFTGLDLKTDMIPVKSAENSITYRIYSDGKAVADAELHKTRACGIVLAIYDEPVISGLSSYEVLVPVNSVIEIYENGQIKDNDIHIKEDTENPQYFYIPAKSTLSSMGIQTPSYKWIKLEGIFDISQLEVKIDEDILHMVEISERKYFAAYIKNDSLNEELRSRAAYVAEKYANYISSDFPYNSLRSMIVYNAPFANRLLNVTLLWYGAHNGVETKEMKVSDALKLTDRDYMLNVNFRYITYGVYNTTDEDTRLSVYLHLDNDGVWRISELMNNIQMDWIKAYEIY